MRLFRASQPEPTAEDRAAAVRLMAVANRSRGGTSFDPAPSESPEGAADGEDNDSAAGEEPESLQ